MKSNANGREEGEGKGKATSDDLEAFNERLQAQISARMISMRY